jgi:hypothetical protein
MIALAFCSAKEPGTPRLARHRCTERLSSTISVSPVRRQARGLADCEWAKTGDLGIVVGRSLDIGADGPPGATAMPISVGLHGGFWVEAQVGLDDSDERRDLSCDWKMNSWLATDADTDACELAASCRSAGQREPAFEVARVGD